MKKKNNDLKKLALMGLTGGLLISATTLKASENNQNEFFSNNASQYGSYLAANCSGGCHNKTAPTWQGGGSHGCNGTQPSHSCNTNSQPSHGCNTHQPVASCSSQPNVGWKEVPYQGGNIQSQNVRQGGCGGQNPNQANAYTRQGGCGGQNPNQANGYTRQGGCGGQRPSQAYAENITPDKNILDHQGQDADKANTPRKGYVADMMGDGTKRMETEANRMNPQNAKNVADKRNGMINSNPNAQTPNVNTHTPNH